MKRKSILMLILMIALTMNPNNSKSKEGNVIKVKSVTDTYIKF